MKLPDDKIMRLLREHLPHAYLNSPNAAIRFASEVLAAASYARFIEEHGHRLAQLLRIEAFDITDRDAQIMAALNESTSEFTARHLAGMNWSFPTKQSKGDK